MKDVSKPKINNSKKLQLKNLILSNCNYHHPPSTSPSTLPTEPFFLSFHSSATPILESLLKDSNHNSSEFSNKAAESILLYNQQDIAQTLKYLKFQQEAKEIQDFFRSESVTSEPKSFVEFKILRNHSPIGEVYAKISINSIETDLHATENLVKEISIEDSADIKILVNEEKGPKVLENFQIFFKEVSKESISDLKKEEIQRVIEKKNSELNLKFLVCLRIGNKEKDRILVKRLKELELFMNEENMPGVIYNDLIESLQIFHDFETGQFKTLIREIRHNGRNCCATCEIT